MQQSSQVPVFCCTSSIVCLFVILQDIFFFNFLIWSEMNKHILLYLYSIFSVLKTERTSTDYCLKTHRWNNLWCISHNAFGLSTNILDLTSTKVQQYFATMLLFNRGGGGGWGHKLRHMEMCRSNGSFFTNPKHGFHFLIKNL